VPPSKFLSGCRKLYCGANGKSLWLSCLAEFLKNLLYVFPVHSDFKIGSALFSVSEAGEGDSYDLKSWFSVKVRRIRSKVLRALADATRIPVIFERVWSCAIQPHVPLPCLGGLDSGLAPAICLLYA